MGGILKSHPIIPISKNHTPKFIGNSKYIPKISGDNGSLEDFNILSKTEHSFDLLIHESLNP